MSRRCPCGEPLPLGPWQHARCPRCLAVVAAAQADPLGAAHASDPGEARDALLGFAVLAICIAAYWLVLVLIEP